MKRQALLILFILFFADQVDAASLVLESKTNEIKLNNTFQIDILLNSPDNAVNTIGGNINFPRELIELKEIRDGDSIINFWVEKPKVENGIISFSGIIPGGYNETNGLLFSLIFKASSQGDALVYLNQIQAFKNDGLGTPISLNLSNLSFFIRDYFDNQEPFDIIDKERPETFVPQISQDKELFDGKYFLVFATQDKGVGIDYYKVCEGDTNNCVVAESPYVLKHQDLDKKIYVKAIDKNGNERTSIIYPQNQSPWYENYLIFAIIFLIIVFVIILIKKIWKKTKNY